MENKTKLILGVSLVVVGLIAYNKSDSKIEIKAKDDVGGKTLSVGVILAGAYLLYKSK